MKPVFKGIVILLSFLPLISRAQTNFKDGSITNSSGEEKKELIRLSKGKLVGLSSTNTKTEYKPAEVKNFKIDGENYISYSNDFYKEIVTGAKAVLYQKVSDNSEEKLYNGTEVVGYLKTTEGRVGDYYILLTNEKELNLVTRKMYKDYFTKLFVNHEDLVSKVKNGTLGYDQIKESVELYNTN